MRTTIDLPDPLFRAVKSKAASEGLKLKDFISSVLRSSIETSTDEGVDHKALLVKHQQYMEEHFRHMGEGRPSHEPIASLNREALHDRHD